LVWSFSRTRTWFTHVCYTPRKTVCFSSQPTCNTPHEKPNLSSCSFENQSQNQTLSLTGSSFENQSQKQFCTPSLSLTITLSNHKVFTPPSHSLSLSRRPLCRDHSPTIDHPVHHHHVIYCSSLATPGRRSAAVGHLGRRGPTTDRSRRPHTGRRHERHHTNAYDDNRYCQ
jgi:hypothetical protein